MHENFPRGQIQSVMLEKLSSAAVVIGTFVLSHQFVLKLFTKAIQ